jgi:predicted small secreted protein
VKLQMLIVPVLAAAALTSGCASWDGHDRGNDYQCGYGDSNETYYGVLAGRQRPGCGTDYAAAAVAHETITRETL